MGAEVFVLVLVVIVTALLVTLLIAFVVVKVACRPLCLSSCNALLHYCVQRTVILSYDLLCCSVNHVMNINTLSTQVMQKVARKRFYKMKEKNTDDANPQSLNVSTSRSSFSLVYEK